MKKTLTITGLLLLLGGCNMSENKESRIRKLELQNEENAAKLKTLEARIQALESITHANHAQANDH